jgi:hypothetical protein
MALFERITVYDAANITPCRVCYDTGAVIAIKG